MYLYVYKYMILGDDPCKHGKVQLSSMNVHDIDILFKTLLK